MILFNDIECKSGVARIYLPTEFGGLWVWRGAVEFKSSQPTQEVLPVMQSIRPSEYIGPLYGMPIVGKIEQVTGDVYITSLIFGESDQEIKGVRFEGTGAPKVRGKSL